jgi:hypothetical protein
MRRDPLNRVGNSERVRADSKSDVTETDSCLTLGHAGHRNYRRDFHG